MTYEDLIKTGLNIPEEHRNKEILLYIDKKTLKITGSKLLEDKIQLFYIDITPSPKYNREGKCRACLDKTFIVVGGRSIDCELCSVNKDALL